MDKKRVLIASSFVTIIILVSFSAAAGSIDYLKLVKKPVKKVGIITNDDSLSAIIENSPYIINISKLDKGELAKLEELKTEVEKMKTTLSRYMEIPGAVTDTRKIEFLQPDGILIAEIPLVLETPYVAERSMNGAGDNSNCFLLLVACLIVSAQAAVLSAVCIFSEIIDNPFLPDNDFFKKLWCAAASAGDLLAAAYWVRYEKECGRTSSEVTEVLKENIDCGCQHNREKLEIQKIKLIILFKNLFSRLSLPEPLFKLR